MSSTKTPSQLKADRLKYRAHCLSDSEMLDLYIKWTHGFRIGEGVSAFRFTPTELQFSEHQVKIGIGSGSLAYLTGWPLIRAGLKLASQSLRQDSENEEPIEPALLKIQGDAVVTALTGALRLLSITKTVIATDPDVKDGEYGSVIGQLEHALALFETDKKPIK